MDNHPGLKFCCHKLLTWKGPGRDTQKGPGRDLEGTQKGHPEGTQKDPISKKYSVLQNITRCMCPIFFKIRQEA